MAEMGSRQSADSISQMTAWERIVIIVGGHPENFRLNVCIERRAVIGQKNADDRFEPESGAAQSGFGKAAGPRGRVTQKGLAHLLVRN